MDSITKARQALEERRADEANLIRLVCPKCGQWVEVVPRASALCQVCDRVMKEGAKP